MLIAFIALINISYSQSDEAEKKLAIIFPL